jgi:hemolysin III
MAKKEKIVRAQTFREEMANAAIHGLGVLLAIGLFPLLYAKAKEEAPEIAWTFCVFSFGMLMTYLSSSIYHFVQKPEAKKKLRIWDHISIFFLIGGTYTPIIYGYLDHRTTIIFLGIMWTLIAAGSILKIFFTGKFNRLSTFIYLFLGWMLIFIFRPLMRSMPLDIFWWLLAGGLSYTLGVIFYKWKTLPYSHAIWHCFVLAGTLFQYVAVYKSIH